MLIKYFGNCLFVQTIFELSINGLQKQVNKWFPSHKELTCLLELEIDYHIDLKLVLITSPCFMKLMKLMTILPRQRSRAPAPTMLLILLIDKPATPEKMRKPSHTAQNAHIFCLFFFLNLDCDFGEFMKSAK